MIWTTALTGISGEHPFILFRVRIELYHLAYSDLVVPAKAVAGTEVTVSVTVTNTGEMTGDEVVQLYLTDEKATTPRPLRQLEGFDRLTLKPGESRRVEFP